MAKIANISVSEIWV